MYIEMKFVSQFLVNIETDEQEAGLTSQNFSFEGLNDDRIYGSQTISQDGNLQMVIGCFVDQIISMENLARDVEGRFVTSCERYEVDKIETE